VTIFEAYSGDSAGRTMQTDPSAPLAVRMRPTNVDEVVGQQHLVAAGSPLRRLVEGAGLTSLILYGPPGSGKTTLAYLVADAARRPVAGGLDTSPRRVVQLSALNAGVKDVRAVIDGAQRDLERDSIRTVLFIDEIHRFSKAQQDSLLAAVENRVLTLLAATTENPSFSIIAPLLSRSVILSLKPLTDEDLSALIDRALQDERGLGGRYLLDTAAREHLLRLADGDARRALTALEAAAEAAGSTTSANTGPEKDGPENAGAVVIDLETVETAVNTVAARYDRDGDQHYDIISAFIKSMRGSDVDAALHYLARLIDAGEDPRYIARRLVVHASEDVGLADPTALLVATAAAQAVALIGMPEARINLAQATMHIALAPKSNSVVRAIDAAVADVRRGLVGPVPPALRDRHGPARWEAPDEAAKSTYRYPHDAPDGVLPQQYPPDRLVGRDYYQPSAHGAERSLSERLTRLRAIVRRQR